MFETIFKTELINIKTDKFLMDNLWKEILYHYTAPNRHYHNLTHLDNLINELSIIRHKIDDWQTIVFSVAYHDVIYNVFKSDSEERSAEFAVQRLTLIKVPEDKKIKCRAQILQTRGHNISSDSDTNYFTDADLAILGSEYSLYKQYAHQIRNEYKLYPDLLYNSGRKKF